MQSTPFNQYRENVGGENMVDRCREALCTLFHTTNPGRVILCSGATEAMNMAIFGLLGGNGHVITTQKEHNAVLRPLYFLRDRGLIDLDILPYHPHRGIDVDGLAQRIRDDTRMVAVCHASNVTGHVQPLEEVHALCADLQLPLLIDAAQSVGAVDFDVSTLPGSVWVFTGHKALLGPPGTGGMVVGEEVALSPWKFGGTGFRSERESMPDEWPQRLEPGTPNYPGIAGLCAGVEYLLEHGIDRLGARRTACVETLCRYLGPSEYACHSEAAAGNPCGIVSFSLDSLSCEDIGYILYHSYDIRVRTGLHCAPLIHHALGTYPDGTVRASFSCFTTTPETDSLIGALEDILSVA